MLLQESGFSPGSCFDAEDITWVYDYSIHNTNNTVIMASATESDVMTVPNVQSGSHEYTVVVVPSAVELGLSGTPASFIVGESSVELCVVDCY